MQILILCKIKECMHVIMYVCMYVWVCMYALMYVCMCVCVYVCMYVHMPIYACMCACMNAYIYVCVCMYVCVCVCMYVCLYAHTSTHVCVFVHIIINISDRQPYMTETLFLISSYIFRWACKAGGRLPNPLVQVKMDALQITDVLSRPDIIITLLM